MTRPLIVILLILTPLFFACQSAPATPTPTPQPPRILVLTPEEYTFGGGTIVERILQAAGGINAAADLPEFNQIADWQIRALAPDIILFSSTWTPDQIATWTSAPYYADLPAIKNKRFYQLDFSLADADLLANEAARIQSIQALITRR